MLSDKILDFGEEFSEYNFELLFMGIVKFLIGRMDAENYSLFLVSLVGVDSYLDDFYEFFGVESIENFKYKYCVITKKNIYLFTGYF